MEPTSRRARARRRGGRPRGRARVLVVLLGFGGLAPVDAAGAVPEGPPVGGHREVVLATDGTRLWPVSQRILETPLPAPPAGERPPSALRVQGLDPSGNVVHDTVVANPLEVHTDAYDGARLTGGTMRLTEGRVVVPLPLDGIVSELVVSGPRVDTTRVALPPQAEAGPAEALASTTLRSNGPVGDRIDVTFLGDGYTSAEMGRYRSDVAAMNDYLFSQPPFSQYERHFNVHRVDVVSAQSGTDDVCAGANVDTALGTGFSSTGVDCRLLWTTRQDLVYGAAASAPGADIILVIVNTDRYGGSANFGGFAVFYRGTHAGEVMLHELAHSFGLLEDEYDYADGSVYTGPDPTAPNVTTNFDRATTKWRGWIDPATAIPTSWTPARSDDVPGLYEGALFRAQGIYRPTYRSKMRDLYRPFERVDHALLTRRIFELLPADPSPATGSARAVGTDGQGRLTVRLSYADPQSHVLSYQLSNYPDFRDSARLPASNAPTFDATVPWTPLAGAGPKTVYVRIVNGSAQRTNQAFTVTSDLLRNGGFEEDGDADGAPDSWTIDPRFRRSSISVAGGSWSGRHRATNNSDYTVSQTATGVQAGAQYTAAVSVDIPPTTDSFTFKVQVQWLQAGGSVIRTVTVGTWSASTPWVRASTRLSAPSGASRARVRMVASSLAATIYVDDVVLSP